jgi:hypothetical protein
LMIRFLRTRRAHTFVDSGDFPVSRAQSVRLSPIRSLGQLGLAAQDFKIRRGRAGARSLTRLTRVKSVRGRGVADTRVMECRKHSHTGAIHKGWPERESKKN